MRYSAMMLTGLLAVSPLAAELTQTPHMKWGESQEQIPTNSDLVLRLAGNIHARIPCAGLTYSGQDGSVTALRDTLSATVTDAEIDSMILRNGNIELVDEGLNRTLTRVRDGGKDVYRDDVEAWKRGYVVGTSKRNLFTSMYEKELLDWSRFYESCAR